MEWFTKLKQDIVKYNIYSIQTKNVLNELLNNNLFISTDIILCENFTILQEQITKNNLILNKLIILIKKLENNLKYFDVDDISVLFMCVKENIVMERRLLKNCYQIFKMYQENKLEKNYQVLKNKEQKYIQDMGYNYEEFNSIENDLKM